MDGKGRRRAARRLPHGVIRGRGEGAQPRNVCEPQSDCSFTATLQSSHRSLSDTPLQEHPGKGVLGAQFRLATLSCPHASTVPFSLFQVRNEKRFERLARPKGILWKGLRAEASCKPRSGVQRGWRRMGGVSHRKALSGPSGNRLVGEGYAFKTASPHLRASWAVS